MLWTPEWRPPSVAERDRQETAYPCPFSQCYAQLVFKESSFLLLHLHFNHQAVLIGSSCASSFQKAMDKLQQRRDRMGLSSARVASHLQTDQSEVAQALAEADWAELPVLIPPLSTERAADSSAQ